MARQPRRQALSEPAVNPLVAAHFRAVNDTSTLAPAATRASDPEALDAKAGLAPQRPRALLEGARSQPSRVALIRTLIEHVRDSDHALYLARTHEVEGVVAVANVLDQ